MSRCLRFWLLAACVLSFAAPNVDAASDVQPLPAYCDSSAAASSQDGCAAHPGQSPARSDGVVAEPDLRTLKGASPRSAPPVFGALLEGAPRLTAPQLAPLALPGHSRAELRRHPALFVLRC